MQYKNLIQPVATIADCERCDRETLTILVPHLVVPDPEEEVARELTEAEVKECVPTPVLLCLDCITYLMERMIAEVKEFGFL